MYRSSSIDERVSPMWLPQMDAPLDYVKEQLSMEGVEWVMEEKVDPKSLNPLQKSVFKSKVDEFYNMIEANEPIAPTYASAENDTLDGHHRQYAFIKHPDVVGANVFKVMLPTKDAVRVLNKIQDKYNWEKDLANGKDKILSFTDDMEGMEDETMPSGDDALHFDDITKNPQTMKLYKSTPINERSRTGDFLLMERKPNFNKEYEIEFDNLLELASEEIAGHQIPSEALAEKWFPEMDLKKEAVNSALPYEVFLNRKIAERAKQSGIDGVRYGDKFVQVIN